MRVHKICDNSSGLKAHIISDYGGMVSKISLKDVDVLYFDSQMLGIGNVLTGGIPLLFPFCGHSMETYKLYGRQYTMPFHGFIKDIPFLVQKQNENEITLYTRPGDIHKNAYYPYDFVLYIKYKIAGNEFYITVTVENRSKQDMPFCFGWHPYFKTSDKKKVEIEMDACQYFDFINNEYIENKIVDSKRLVLSNNIDSIYMNLKKKWVALKNYANQYKVEIHFDNLINAFTLCTKFNNCICLEPWMGRPEEMKIGDYLVWLKPKQIKECGIRLDLNLI